MHKNRFERISVIGLGYIGLPTAAMFASRKIEVIGVDVSQHVVETINRGEIHIVEPDLKMLVSAAVKGRHLRATLTPEPAQAFIIAVPTPVNGDDHMPNLSYVKAAAQAIAPVLVAGNLVVLESTCPVGSTEAMAEWFAHARPDLTFPQTDGEASDIRIAYCPERVLPGKVMQELISNDRVIGGMTPRCSDAASLLYKIFVTGECLVASGPRLAEMCKLAENSFRDVNIAFANELSVVCDELRIDVWQLIRLANRHPRVNILQPGPGVGGHCIAVDPWFIVASAPEAARLIRTAREVNDAKPEWVLKKVREAIGAHLMEHPGKSAADVSISIYGLTFKHDIDDFRESPALEIARKILTVHPGRVVIVEPHILSIQNIIEGSSLLSVDDAEGSDIHLILVAHSKFRGLQFPGKRIIDACGALESKN